MQPFRTPNIKTVVVALIFILFGVGLGRISSQDVGKNVQKKEVVVEENTKKQNPDEKEVGIVEESTVKVLRVVDGDTIEVEGGKTVRYIGVNTPEKNDCLGVEATKKNTELVFGKTVRLEKDISATDNYGRILAYVYLGNIFVNKELVKTGYAYASSYPPDIRYQEELILAQKEAKDNDLGLWKPGVCGVNTTNLEADTLAQGATGNCKYDCLGPDKDCSDFSTQAEAQGFFNCCGFSAERDPMKLDLIKVGDGVACESLP